jgi:hypothetical protein
MKSDVKNNRRAIDDELVNLIRKPTTPAKSKIVVQRKPMGQATELQPTKPMKRREKTSG